MSVAGVEELSVLALCAYFLWSWTSSSSKSSQEVSLKQSSSRSHHMAHKFGRQLTIYINRQVSHIRRVWTSGVRCICDLDQTCWAYKDLSSHLWTFQIKNSSPSCIIIKSHTQTHAHSDSWSRADTYLWTYDTLLKGRRSLSQALF